MTILRDAVLPSTLPCLLLTTALLSACATTTPDEAPTETSAFCPTGAAEQTSNTSRWCTEGSGLLNGSVWFGRSGKLEWLERGSFVSGERQGKWEQRTTKNKPKWSITYEGGKRVGTYTAFYEDGTKRFELTYARGVLQGPAKGWYPNGKEEFSGTFAAGKPSGDWSEWYDNGFKMGTGSYAAGVPDGVHERWYDDGQLAERVTYVGGKPSGLREAWHVNGKPAIRSRHGDDGITLHQRWYVGGQLAEEVRELEGKRHGAYKRWHDNSTLGIVGEYAEGEPVGQWEWRDGMDRVITQIQFVADTEQAMVKEFGEDGAVTSEQEIPRERIDMLPDNLDPFDELTPKLREAFDFHAERAQACHDWYREHGGAATTGEAKMTWMVVGSQPILISMETEDFGSALMECVAITMENATYPLPKAPRVVVYEKTLKFESEVVEEVE